LFLFFFLLLSFHLIFPFGIGGRINPSWIREEEWLVAAFMISLGIIIIIIVQPSTTTTLTQPVLKYVGVAESLLQQH